VEKKIIELKRRTFGQGTEKHKRIVGEGVRGGGGGGGRRGRGGGGEGGRGG